VVGESGCGKSITAMSIMRLIPTPPGKIVDGQVVFQGKDILKMNDEQIRAIRGEEKYPVSFDEMSATVRCYEAVVRSVHSGGIEAV